MKYQARKVLSLLSLVGGLSLGGCSVSQHPEAKLYDVDWRQYHDGPSFYPYNRDAWMRKTELYSPKK